MSHQRVLHAFTQLTPWQLLAIWIALSASLLAGLSGAYAYWTSRASEPALASWTGVGPGRTEIFEVPDGAWQYCPRIERATWDSANVPRGQQPGGTPELRATLFDAAGLWRESVSGKGHAGPVQCGEVHGPGEYELSVRVGAPWLVEWTIDLRQGPAEDAAPGLDEGLGLGPWLPPITRSLERARPVEVDDAAFVFEGEGAVWTPFFRPLADNWSICWETYPTPPLPGVQSSLEVFKITLLVEELWFEEWEDSTPGTYSACVEPATMQTVGRNTLHIEEGSHLRSWRLTLAGVELTD